VVRDVVDELREMDESRTLKLTVPPGRIVCLTDPDRIGQVVQNYVTNAFKYAPSAEPIEVGVRAEEGGARVWVSDRGPGLAASDQERIWERFQRVEGIGHQTGSRIGLGLGLFISKTIVEQHGGQVGIESTPGVGSTFWFTIPTTG
jgi:signal transduction histidine kinase